MSKPKYTPNSEEELWKWFNTHQDDTFQSIAEKFGISEEQARYLSLRWAAGQKESFRKEFWSLFEGSPTNF